MKITSIQTHVCHARMRNWIFVKVLTDQPGLWGWGEATLEWHTRSIIGAIEDISQLLIGEDPTRIEHLWQMMYRQHFWHGNGIVRGTAISGIDIALWDILGKIHGVPCHRLWGGPVRDYVRLYCHLGGGRMEDFYETRPADAARFADLARAAVEDGFTAFKAMAVPETMPLEGLQPIRYAEACVAAMREAVGDKIDIMVDCHARPSPRMGHLFATALEPFNLFFLEEPCWPEVPDDIASIQRSVRTPIATGERLVGVAPFRDLLEKRAASVLQPDLTHCGGFTEARRIAALAEAYRVALAPHNPQGPVSTAAALEFGFATPSYVICETVHADVPWRSDVVREGFSVEKKGRIVKPNTRPGLGIEIDEAEVKKHPFQQEVVLRNSTKMEASVTGNPPLKGQIAVISGGLGDIGRATAHALRGAGALVALSDLAPRAAARRIMPEFHYTRVDVTRVRSLDSWLAFVARQLGPPTVIICNAGIVEPGSALDTNPAQWRRILDVNLSGAFFMAQSAARLMTRQKIQGRIVFVGSWAGHVPHPRITTYSVAKAGLRMAMQCLAMELAPAGILVNEIAPGVVDAGLSGKLMAQRRGQRARTQQRIPVRQLLTADDVARGIVSLCHPDNRHMTGSVVLIDGGLTLRGPL